MASGKFVSYLRVSTDRQGRSGLGLEAQRASVEGWLNGGKHTVLAELVEVESAKATKRGKAVRRPELEKALHLCRIAGATLVIATISRLSRDAHFLLGLEKSGVEFVAVDMPTANRLTVGIMALVAEEEGRLISKRTKDALAAAKARGVKLGGDRGDIAAQARNGAQASAAVRIEKAMKRAADLAPLLADLRATGANSLRAIATGLNGRGIPAPRGAEWSAAQVQRVLARARAT